MFNSYSLVHLLERLVLADIGGNHPLDLLRFQENAKAEIIDTGVVGNTRKTLIKQTEDKKDMKKKVINYNLKNEINIKKKVI